MKTGERGQAVLMLVVAMGLVLFAAVGLTLDGANLYSHRTMAQTAADAAAQAAVMSIFNGTNTGGNAFGSAAFTCGSGDARTPCLYASANGFGTTDDTVSVDFPASMPGVQLSTVDPVAVVRVTVTRNLATTFLRLLGTNAASVKAAGVAAIVDVVSPVPIIVTHPTNGASFQVSGSGGIEICGGPAKSIQVNSSSAVAIDTSGNGPVDLSRAGPADPGNCTTGTGASFGNWGGPGAYPGVLNLGSTGKYIAPASPIKDPLADVSAPARPAGAAPGKTPLANGVSGCPIAPPKPCNLYYPGLYVGGIDVKNETAVFSPGVYYVDGGGFKNAANGVMTMAQGVAADPDTGSGMMVYNTGNGVIDIGANSDASLEGASTAGIYKGILFFQDRAGPAHTGSGSHALGGGGNIALRGTLYMTQTTMTASSYQNLRLRGNSGSTTTIEGMIIASAVDVGGSTKVRMKLDPTARLHVRQVALVK